MGGQSAKTVHEGGSRGQNQGSISKNCPIERLSRSKWGVYQRELSNRASSHRQNEESIRKNCPIERLSRTKWGIDQRKLSNRAALAVKAGSRSVRTVQ